MSGEFISPYRKYALCLLTLLEGAFLTARFCLWGLEEVQAGHSADALFCFVFAVLGFLLGLFAVYLFQFNRKAFFTICADHVDARFGWGQELHTELQAITDAEVSGKSLKLSLQNDIVWVQGLSNAAALCQYILSRIERHPLSTSPEEDTAAYRRIKSSFRRYLVATIAVGLLMPIHIGWCVLLTEGKALADLTASETWIFYGFAWAEAVTVVLTLLLADRCGKRLAALRMLDARIACHHAREHRADGLTKYPGIIAKKYFDHGSYRIVIFAPEQDIFAYMLEKFDAKTRSWVFCYQSPKVFQTLSALYEELEECFEDVILED